MKCKIFLVMSLITILMITGCGGTVKKDVTVQIKDDNGNTVTVTGTTGYDDKGNTIIKATDSAGNEVLIKGDIDISKDGNVEIKDAEINTNNQLVADNGEKVEVPTKADMEVTTKPSKEEECKPAETQVMQNTEKTTEGSTQATVKETQSIKPTEKEEVATQVPTVKPTEAPTVKPTESATVPTQAPTEAETQKKLTYSEGIDAVIKYINEYRIAEGHEPLIRSEKLCEMAEYRMHQMVEVKRWNHNYNDMVAASTAIKYGNYCVNDYKLVDGQIVKCEPDEITYEYRFTGMEAISFAGGSDLQTDRFAWALANDAYVSKEHWAYIGSTAPKYANMKYIGIASSGYGAVIWVDSICYD